MKIKFRDPETGEDRLLDSEQTPVLLICGEKDTANLEMMIKRHSTRLLSYPTDYAWSHEESINWMWSE